MQSFFVVFFIVSLSASTYIIKSAINSDNPTVKTIIEGSSSTILDIEGNNITTLNLIKTNSVARLKATTRATTKAIVKATEEAGG